MESCNARATRPGAAGTLAATDAVCSSSDEGHDALMTLYHQRYTEQIEVADASTVMERWEP
jgi:hypothetical protein